MKNLLSQLKDQEAILLMYLADELPPRDRAQVEISLRHDAEMRQALEELDAATEQVGRGLRSQEEAISLKAERCAREAIKAMRQWQASPRPASVIVPEEKRLPLPWWSYPLTAAASVLIAAAVFFANMEPSRVSPPISEPTALSVPDLLSSQVLADLSSPAALDQYAFAEDLAASFGESFYILSDAQADTGIFAASHEVATLRALSEDAFASVDWRW